MAKNKTAYVCQNCGYSSSKWMGKCPGCGEWNSMTEEFIVEDKHPAGAIVSSADRGNAVKLSDIDSKQFTARISTGIPEVDRVLGGGYVPSSLVLLGGDPGIGKSTLVLQICGKLPAGKRVLYVSGEESAPQIRMRAERLGINNPDLLLLSENSMTVILACIEREKPDFLIIDSIQTVYSDDMSSSPGSVGQVREVTGLLLKLAKAAGITTMIIGHVTKEGNLAGPRVLEHMVDTVLYFEGERNLPFRVLRGVKNRFGSTNEIGLFEMTGEGLSPVENPADAMLTHRDSNISGAAVVCGMEGTRPLLTEIQALASKSPYNLPKRTVNGTDMSRVGMLLAVAEKMLHLPLWERDVYINVAGGIRLTEPACDLGMLAAVYSAVKDVPLERGAVYCGEVGLTGEVRAVSRMDMRIMEAVRTGFTAIYLPAANYNKLTDKQKREFGSVELRPVANVKELF